ncbi:MAG: hypothetical protein QGH85_02240 [Candidatus Pacebacteria bacterium]|jgi:hypothetical protein|nr:hypothetical protein [Parcubacteria group bacterium]MDP6249566.1 hypothetical protein [Candidatus Paceibacterota bacterium]MDP7159010.1 hypothetical protein [Candidatus Paceibacterota bacterium]MDP7366554.1 hypothetical protein [Candidatus Paceibacterota bacterium]MDP7466416.1 hypothetical protein [Candidatus Paceibacterota bacterium]|tara:strand:+ start:448 stop:672 length:225 start_codon:yes stop_codon:yes gene_type:complete
MPNLIGRIGNEFKSIEVGRDTFRKFTKTAIKHGCSTDKVADFTDAFIKELFEDGLPLTEESVKQYLSKYKEITV